MAPATGVPGGTDGIEAVWDSRADVLARFRADPRASGIMTDFDGTISEIVPDYSGARIIAEARDVLSRLAAVYPLYVVSGRRAEDVAALVGLDNVVYLGVHGLEWMDPGGAAQPDPEVAGYAASIREAAELLLAAPEISKYSLVLEDKAWTVGIHWRPAVEAGGDEQVLEDIARTLAGRVADRLGLKIYGGRKVVEIRPPLEANKGTGVEHFIRRDGLDRCLYIGDDRTDVDVFRLFERLERESDFRGLRVAVASPEAPAELLEFAEITLPSPASVAPFLTPLI